MSAFFSFPPTVYSRCFSSAAYWQCYCTLQSSAFGSFQGTCVIRCVCVCASQEFHAVAADAHTSVSKAHELQSGVNWLYLGSLYEHLTYLSPSWEILRLIQQWSEYTTNYFSVPVHEKLYPYPVSSEAFSSLRIIQGHWRHIELRCSDSQRIDGC